MSSTQGKRKLEEDNGQARLVGLGDQEIAAGAEYRPQKRSVSLLAGRSVAPELSTNSCDGCERGRVCQVRGCGASLEGLRRYFVRMRVCADHLFVPVIIVDGVPSRFCQQCARFQPITDFTGNKRSCTARLEKHNQRHRAKVQARRTATDGKAAGGRGGNKGQGSEEGGSERDSAVHTDFAFPPSGAAGSPQPADHASSRYRAAGDGAPDASLLPFGGSLTSPAAALRLLAGLDLPASGGLPLGGLSSGGFDALAAGAAVQPLGLRLGGGLAAALASAREVAGLSGLGNRPSDALLPGLLGHGATAGVERALSGLGASTSAASTLGSNRGSLTGLVAPPLLLGEQGPSLGAEALLLPPALLSALDVRLGNERSAGTSLAREASGSGASGSGRSGGSLTHGSLPMGFGNSMAAARDAQAARQSQPWTLDLSNNGAPVCGAAEGGLGDRYDRLPEQPPLMLSGPRGAGGATLDADTLLRLLMATGAASDDRGRGPHGQGLNARPFPMTAAAASGAAWQSLPSVRQELPPTAAGPALQRLSTGPLALGRDADVDTGLLLRLLSANGGSVGGNGLSVAASSTVRAEDETRGPAAGPRPLQADNAGVGAALMAPKEPPADAGSSASSSGSSSNINVSGSDDAFRRALETLAGRPPAATQGSGPGADRPLLGSLLAALAARAPPHPVSKLTGEQSVCDEGRFLQPPTGLSGARLASVGDRPLQTALAQAQGLLALGGGDSTGPPAAVPFSARSSNSGDGVPPCPAGPAKTTANGKAASGGDDAAALVKLLAAAVSQRAASPQGPTGGDAGGMPPRTLPPPEPPLKALPPLPSWMPVGCSTSGRVGPVPLQPGLLGLGGSGLGGGGGGGGSTQRRSAVVETPAVGNGLLDLAQLPLRTAPGSGGSSGGGLDPGLADALLLQLLRAVPPQTGFSGA